MAGFLYYFPDVDPSQVSPSLLESRGLELPFRDLFIKWQPSHNVTIAPIHHGPDGKDGCYIYPIPETGNLPRTHGFNPSEQEWEDHERYWLGIDTENRPTPPELVRPTVVEGHLRQLGDGCEWECPVLRSGDEPRVPQSWGKNGDGFFQKILPQWEWAWDLSGVVWDYFTVGKSVTLQEAFEIACKLLSVNYRLGEFEITKLGLLTSDNYVQVFKDAAEIDLWMMAMADIDDQKKSEDSHPSIVNSSSGIEENPSADTDPAEQPSP